MRWMDGHHRHLLLRPLVVFNVIASVIVIDAVDQALRMSVISMLDD